MQAEAFLLTTILILVASRQFLPISASFCREQEKSLSGIASRLKSLRTEIGKDRQDMSCYVHCVSVCECV